MYVKKLFIDKKLESGRSMVEMLGVLAIVGVLSIGGIVGYQYSMTKRAANELANDLWIEAVNLSVQALQKNNELKIASPKTSGGYDVDAFYIDDNKNAFEITVDGVPYDVCQQVLNMSWSTPPNKIDIGENGDESCVKDASHIMNFVFDAALQGIDVSSDEGDGEDEKESCTGGTMIGSKCCPAGSIVENGECCKNGKCCPAGEHSVRDEETALMVCCSSKSVGAIYGVCCEQEITPNNGIYACCPKGIGAVNGECCNNAGEGRGEILGGGGTYKCCPQDLISWKDGGFCCDTGKVIDGYCCSSGVTAVGWRIYGEGCCALGEIVVDGMCCPKDGPCEDAVIVDI